jgi:hypothetical protein
MVSALTKGTLKLAIAVNHTVAGSKRFRKSTLWLTRRALVMATGKTRTTTMNFGYNAVAD